MADRPKQSEGGDRKDDSLNHGGFLVRRIGCIALAIYALGLSGCGFIASTNVEYGPRFFGGIRYDCGDILPGSFPLGALCALLDFPFSLLADVLFLPVNLAETLRNSRTDTSPTIIDGFIVEGGESDVETFDVITSSPLRDTLKALVNAHITVLQRANGNLTESVVRGTTRTENTGYFSLLHDTDTPWETIRIERAGFRSVEIAVSHLHNLTDREFWKFHSL